MKLPITVYLFLTKYSWEESGNYSVLSVKLDDTEYRTFICEQEVELDIPDNYDPTAQKIFALNVEKAAAFDTFTKTVATLNEKIGKLQAIAYTA